MKATDMRRVRAMVMGLAAAMGALFAFSASGALIGPYTADADTLMLYHFDEAAGSGDPGTPILNYGAKGATYNLANTGGPDGRDNAGGGGYGASAYSGFGSAFDVLGSGDGTYHGGTSPTGGGANTAAGSPLQADFQGAAGQFTYEALVKLPNLTSEHHLLNRDNSTAARGFVFFTTAAGQLAFGGGTGAGSVTPSIPTSGDNAFVANEWFHVAVTYDGNGGVAGNTKLYWTRVNPSFTAANLLTSGMLNDAANATTEFYVGTQGRGAYRLEASVVDEVRISSVVRGADEFIFAVPEPGTVGLIGLIGFAGYLRRRLRG